MVNYQRPITVATDPFFASIESLFDKPALALCPIMLCTTVRKKESLWLFGRYGACQEKKKILIKPCLFWSMSLWTLTSSFIAFSSTKNHYNNWKDVDHGRRECKPELLS